MAFFSRRGNLAASVLLLAGVLMAGLYYQRAHTVAAERAENRYYSAAQTRHARLRGQVTVRQQLLQNAAAFFAASSQVSAEEFDIFGRSFLASQPLRALCWTSTIDDDHLAATEAGAEGACDQVDLLEPSRVVSSGPLIILSTFTATRSGSQKGFVSLAFTIDSIFLSEPSELLDEYLVVNNSIQNTATTYLFQSAAPVLLVDDLRSPRHFELATFGSVQFLYLTTAPASRSGDPTAALIAGFLLTLSLIIALYVRNLLQTREVVIREVEARTAELAQFSYRTSHDLRGPLVTIAGLCRAALEDMEDGMLEDVSHSLGRIAHHAGRLDALVGDLLSLTRADLQEHAEEPVDVAQLLDEVHADLSETMPGHRVATLAEVSLEGPCMVQRTRLSQILTNLISNGIKYASPDVTAPFVRTTVDAVGRSLRITVLDNGRGIPSDHQERAFAMFERLHPEASVPGSGLGLAIVQKHVEHLGGRIQLDSSPQGSSFTLTIPLKISS